MDLTTRTTRIGHLDISEVFDPVGGIDGASKNEEDFVDGLEITPIDHDRCGFVFDVSDVLEFFGLRAEVTLPVDDLLLGAVGNQRVHSHIPRSIDIVAASRAAMAEAEADSQK